MLSIWRMRSRVTLNCFPIFSRVCFICPCKAKRFLITCASFSVRTIKRLLRSSCRFTLNGWAADLVEGGSRFDHKEGERQPSFYQKY